MGGFFSPQQTPATIADPTPRALHPFREELIRAVAGLLSNPPGARLAPLEESQILATAGMSPFALDTIMSTATGQFLPGQGRENPFLAAMLRRVDEEGEMARRQLAAAAQRAGALSSTDYLNAATGLEAQLQERKARMLGDLFEQERSRMLQSAFGLPEFSAALTNLFGTGRRARIEAIRWPFELGAGMLGGMRGQFQPGETLPSPFASLLNALAPFARFVKL